MSFGGPKSEGEGKGWSVLYLLNSMVVVDYAMLDELLLRMMASNPYISA